MPEYLLQPSPIGRTTRTALQRGVVSTWTPVLTFSTPGDLSVTYNIQEGRYWLNVDEVVVRFLVHALTFTHSTASGLAQITGLPFTSTSFGASLTGTGSMAFNGVTKAGYTQIVPSVRSSVNYIVFEASGSGVAQATLQAADLPSGSSKTFGGQVAYSRI